MVGSFLDVITSGAVLFLVTLGLLIVFGMMRVINFAHGAFITVGAYASVIVTQASLSPWLALLVAPVMGGILGAIVEPIIMRKLYHRQLDTILATWGLALVLTQVITLGFGRGAQVTSSVSLGAVSVFGTDYSLYRLLLVPLAIGITLGLVFLLQRTRFGLVGRAVIMDEDLAQALRVDTIRVRFVSFVFGSCLAAFAGAVIVPLSSVDPNLGLPWLIDAFMISLLVGVSARALAMAALVLGAAQVMVALLLNAEVATLAVPVLTVLILRARPAGFVRTTV